MKKLPLFASLVLVIAATGCSVLPDLGFLAPVPSPLPVPSPTPLPSAEVTFTVVPPQGTDPASELTLILLDEVTGLALNQRQMPMTRLPDGRYQAQLTPPIGSLLRYRYVRTAPSYADEITATGRPVEMRLAVVHGAAGFEDLVAAWSDTPYDGPTGRIVGTLREAGSNRPLREMIVAAGGKTTFTDGDGEFRLESLPPGLHRLTAVAPDGAYRPAQQGALVAANSTTPAVLAMESAPLVQLTFELTVPGDTIPGTPVRMAGNLIQLGNIFAELPGGVRVSAVRMPTLTFVDPTHYLMLLEVHAGTDLRYKYSIGDALWNAERGGRGGMIIRELIVPNQHSTIRDTVASWHAGDRGSIQFHVTTPPETPADSSLAIQFNPFTWFEPIPMWRLSEDEWYFVLHGPLDYSGSLGYRYCRNLQCGAADDRDTGGPDAVGRQAPAATVGQDLRDQVRGWSWWESAPPSTSVVAPDITPRPDFEVGVEMLATYQPGWAPMLPQALADLDGFGSNTVTLTPAWTLEKGEQLPNLVFDPARAPFARDLARMAQEAQQLGLAIAVRPTLLAADGDVSDWWSSAARDPGWWTTWYDEYRSFALTYARLAAEIGATKLVLGGPEAAPSFPGGLLEDGLPAGAPPDAAARWTTLIEEVRERFPGILAFEIEYDGELGPLPPFLDAVDEIHLYFHAPLGDSKTMTVEEMQAGAAGHLERLLGIESLADHPLVLSVEYVSVDGTATGCVPHPDQTCRPGSDFDSGAVVDVDLPVDHEEQARAINALLLEAFSQEGITGFYVRRYHPVVALQDKSASVNGKPARDVLWYWYPRITGEIQE